MSVPPTTRLILVTNTAKESGGESCWTTKEAETGSSSSDKLQLTLTQISLSLRAAESLSSQSISWKWTWSVMKRRLTKSKIHLRHSLDNPGATSTSMEARPMKRPSSALTTSRPPSITFSPSCRSICSCSCPKQPICTSWFSASFKWYHL